MPNHPTDQRTREAIQTARRRHLAELETWTWDDLVREYGVGRSTVRRALEEDGLIGLERGDVDPETLEIRPGAGTKSNSGKSNSNSRPDQPSNSPETPPDSEDTTRAESPESGSPTSESGDGLTEYTRPGGTTRPKSRESRSPTGESDSMTDESDDRETEPPEDPPTDDDPPAGDPQEDVVDVVECRCGAQLGVEPDDGPTITCPSCSRTVPIGDDVGVCSSCEAVLEIEPTDPGRITCPSCGNQQVRA